MEKEPVSLRIAPRDVLYDTDARHIEYVYDFYAKDLSRAFRALKTFTDENELTPSTITMQKFPEVETVKKKTKKKDADGNPVFSEKKVVKKSDIRWVMSFDWKTKDPAEARVLEYHFYDNGWPGSVVIAANDGIEVESLDKCDCHSFEVSLRLQNNERASKLEKSFSHIMALVNEKKES